jgi:predicted chitinase
MNFPLPIPLVSAILGPYGPLANVQANWPLVEAALDGCNIYSPMCAVAAIATISVETGTFMPIKERGGPAYLANMYEGRVDLGNVEAGDGAKFRGRGFVQITGRWDYEHYGREIGRDLVADPDLALDPAVAAAILATFFFERKIRDYADQQNWEMVRRRVNGGLTGWPRYFDAITRLVSALKIPPASGISPEVAK